MLPDVNEREIRLLLIAPLAAAVLGIGAPLAAAEEERTLARVVYEFAVTGYCGLQDAAVEAGYHAEVAALTARHGFDAEAARSQRLRGWVAAEDERSEESRVGKEGVSRCRSRGRASH